jgi:hypothetical protein
MVIYLAILLAGLGYMFVRLPAASCRTTTRASSSSTCRLPSERPGHRTETRSTQVENISEGTAPASRIVTFLTGFSFLGAGPEHRAGLRHAEGLVGARAGGFRAAIAGRDINGDR